ncbi:MAG: hypothetical protein VXZ43_07895 [Pseudomonadota bacterium]|nr:hypothetical protein [Pseudomonadota bacterium]
MTQIRTGAVSAMARKRCSLSRVSVSARARSISAQVRAATSSASWTSASVQRRGAAAGP